jgi:uncharacterized protein with NAD-binding domain and iron-sulfur cluster
MSTNLSNQVAILGGGVAGMSAAHELIERGFQVEVYEAGSVPGGKARSVSKPGTGSRGHMDLPGEHGFRLFPGFYQHITDTMKRIPYQRQENGVLGNLVPAEQVALATEAASIVAAPTRVPQSLDELMTALHALFQVTKFGISPKEVFYFINRLMVVATSCDERRNEEFEAISWWKFTDAANRSKDYQRFFAVGMTRCTVACRADKTNTRTSGTILLQLLFNMGTLGQQVDRLLCGPTNEVWIDPWLTHLKAKGVKYRKNTEVREIHCVGNQVVGIGLRNEQGALEEVKADFYVAALPVEVMRGLLSDAICTADPQLAEIRNLETAWMNGIQFYLKKDVRIPPGHVVYIDSPWALTSISQHHFWRKKISDAYGDGSVNGILSVDISNWEEKGILFNQPAQQCTREQIKEEVWAQMKRHLNRPGTAPVLDDSNIADWHLDPDIVLSRNGGKTQNREPLLINTGAL